MLSDLHGRGVVKAGGSEQVPIRIGGGGTDWVSQVVLVVKNLLANAKDMRDIPCLILRGGDKLKQSLLEKNLCVKQHC